MPDRNGSARILVADDEPRSLELLVRTLRRLGRVETFPTGNEAWSAAQVETPDVVISDQRMPGMKGVELLARIAGLGEPVGRILLTGYADITATIDAINTGRIHAYVHKPWSPDQVFLTVKSLLERVRLERENLQLLGTLGEKNAALEMALCSLQTAQRQLVDAERLAAIGRMIAMIVHDFRGPLCVVRSAAAELARDATSLPADEIRAVAAGALEEAERMVRMCAELLEVARASQNRAARELHPLDEWISDVVASLAEDASRQGVEVETRLGSGANLMLDADRMRRALLNLCHNALEAMPEGGVLRVETAREAREAHIRVVDSGVGIPDEIRDRLFEPFVTAGKPAGTGLGLAVVKKIVDDHGGAIDVAKAEGGGTVFELRLPVPVDVDPGA
jgi:signal transduction histidine kinase